MIFDKIIIEVKTSWVENDGLFERDVIEYRYINYNSIDNIPSSINYLKEEIINKEKCDFIDKNTFEVSLKSNNLKELNELEKFLLRYVKNKWELY